MFEQMDGVAMGLPLSLVIADFYMEAFETVALEVTPYKPWFYKYVDDTLLLWPHGEQKLKEFVRALNEVHRNIKFTVKMEQDGW